MIPECHSEAVIAHVCMVHGSVGEYSKLFQQTLRRSNYVTPKNFLDFISTYSNLLEDKDKYILGKSNFFWAVWEHLFMILKWWTASVLVLLSSLTKQINQI